MSLYLDIHKGVNELTSKRFTDVYCEDHEIPDKNGVKFLYCSFKEKDGTVYCFCEATSMETVKEVHRKAHGEIEGEIIGLPKVH